MATLEWRNGAKQRNIRRIAEVALRNPTENALAQSVWLKQNANISINPEIKLASTNLANEARSRIQYEKQEFQSAANATWHWLEDESFSARAAGVGASICFANLSDFDQALLFAESGLVANPGNPTLTNYKILSLAYSGRLKDAKVLLSEFELHRHDPKQLPFVNAAQGLLAFRTGDVASGRKHYASAAAAASQNGREAPAINAVAYWLEQETFCGSVSAATAQNLIAEIERKLPKPNNALNRDARQRWATLRARIETNLNDTQLNPSFPNTPQSEMIGEHATRVMSGHISSPKDLRPLIL